MRHIEATQHLGRYEIGKALAIYHKLSMFKIAENEVEKRRMIADDAVSEIIGYSKKYGNEEAVNTAAIGAYTNEEVETLNSAVRSGLKQARILQGRGKLFRSGSGLEEHLIELCVGDRIIFKRNLSEFKGYGGVENNEIGVISRLGAVDDSGIGEFEVRIKDGCGGFTKG